MASLKNKLDATRRFEFCSKAFAHDKFEVVDMNGFESISQPFRFTLTLVTDDADIDFDSMLRRPARFAIFAPDGASSTPYHGILAEFEQLHRADGYVFYRAVLVPRLWQLSLYRISEVYLNEQSIPDIIEDILRKSRLSASDYELKLSGKYRRRSFVCQYQETNLDFLSRWMEKEGMYYYFEHGDADKLVVVDHRRMHAAQAIAVNYRPADELDTGTAPDAVQVFVGWQKPLPHQVILQDYNHRKAALELKAHATVSDTGIGDVMLYGENFRDQEEGNRYAKLRAEEIVCGGKVFSGESTAVGLRSGYFMELAHHYRGNFNGRYLVTELHHSGTQAGALLNGVTTPFNNEAGGETHYSNSFRAVPEAVQFRAARVTPKPRVAGTMNATIDAEGSGEYAELDEYGQYKVQLPFDRDGKNANRGSARIRMATPYSGSNHGMHFPLHKNAEVLLSFTDGDPDMPVIVGTVPNSENISIVGQSNAHENRISTAGGNQLHMSDVKGKEVIWLNSPFHGSSIGIGSVDPRGAGSIFAATLGSSDSISFGNSNSMSFGPKNSLSMGTVSSIDASFANTVTMGGSIGISMANDVAWNMNLLPASLCKSLSIDDSESVALQNKDSNVIALEGYKISAGHSAGNLKVLAIKAKESTLKKLVAAFTALNLTQSAIFGAGVNGDLKKIDDPNEIDARRNKAKKERDAQKKVKQAVIDAKYPGPSQQAQKEAATDALDKEYADLDAIDKSGMEDKNFVGGWPGVITKYGTDTILNAAALIALQGYARTLEAELNVLASALHSVLDLNDKGIFMDVKVPLTGASRLAMDQDGFAVSHEDRYTTNIKGKNGELEIEAGTSVSIVSGGQSSLGTRNKVSLSMGTGQAALSAEAATGGMNTLSIKNNAVSLMAKDNGFFADAFSTKLNCGNVGVEAGTYSLKLGLNANKAEFSSVGVTVTGQLIKLG